MMEKCDLRHRCEGPAGERAVSKSAPITLGFAAGLRGACMAPLLRLLDASPAGFPSCRAKRATRVGICGVDVCG